MPGGRGLRATFAEVYAKAWDGEIDLPVRGGLDESCGDEPGPVVGHDVAFRVEPLADVPGGNSAVVFGHGAQEVLILLRGCGKSCFYTVIS